MKLILRVTLFVIATIQIAIGGGFQLNEHGARAVGQGGAWVARAFDPSAIYYNPAGLAFQRGTWISFGTTVIAPTSSYYGTGTGQLDMVSQVFTPINGYITSSLTDDLVVGLGVYNPFGLGTEWPATWTGRYITTKADLVSFFFSPTVAYKITDDLSIGVGVNYIVGGAKISRIVSDPFGQQEHTATVDADGTGWGFNAGILYNISERLSFGASYRTGSTIEASGTATFTPGLSVLPGGDVTTSLSLPSTGYVGIAYAVTEDLDIEVDYQFVGWSSYDSLSVTLPDGVDSSPKMYEDTYLIRAGGEYTMGNMQIRAGYFFDANPIPDTYVEPTLPDGNRHGFNVGLGYQVTKSISVDAFFMYIKGVQRTVKNTYVGLDGTYSNSASLFGVNVSYGF